MAKIVDFFKCYFPETSAQRLQLLTSFSLQIQGALPERAFLRDHYTNMWPVKMTKIENNWFFEDGWEKFVQDNSMEKRDVFVFKYDGENLFDVKLLGLSGCEKKGVGEFRMSVKEETAYKIVDHEEIEDDREVEDIYDSDDSDDNADDYLQYVEEDEDVEAEEDNVEDGKEDDINSKDDDYYFNTEDQKPRLKQILKQKSCKCLMFIPREVVDYFQVPLPDKMLLIDPEGRKWETKLCIWKDGRPWYRGGWKNLCRVNFVCEDDRCICEFVKGKGREGLCLHVNVVKAKKD
ncbi:putative B3 domain-containing protein [Forsythia ovata]|uniref:B3 domain-containing protein n=1 Tax=Forsythia ovata TaxID=205694 RepID=A0ABD1UWF5_9LAMI